MVLSTSLIEVPGVGLIAALSFMTAVDDPSRFKRSRDVAAYFGLTSRRWQSGSSDGRHVPRGSACAVHRLAWNNREPRWIGDSRAAARMVGCAVCQAIIYADDPPDGYSRLRIAVSNAG
jgi:transposase